MKKPRVIIADTDAGYIVPLQLKFVDEYFNQIELEIITEEAYFDTLFSSPQAIDVLIISEDLFRNDLQRHNIGKIFVMQEQLDEEETTAALCINRIAKYSSIKEIFNEIIGKSSPVFEKSDSNKKQEPQIILVCSAGGGVGKTTVALGLCAALSGNYKRVLYINADRLQTFQAHLANMTPISDNDVYTKLIAGSKNAYNDVRHTIRAEGFQYLPPFKAALMSLGLSYLVFEKIALAAKQSNTYDFIVVDADSAFDEYKSRLIDAADRVIVVTTQHKAAVLAANRLCENINGASSEKFIYICNNYDASDENALTNASVNLRFTVNDYIQHFLEFDQKSIALLAKERDIQKLAYLLI